LVFAVDPSAHQHPLVTIVIGHLSDHTDDVEFEDYLHFEGNRRMLTVKLPLAMVAL
jgi:hypothetical protein